MGGGEHRYSMGNGRGHRWCVDKAWIVHGRAWESIKFNIMLNRLKPPGAFPPGMPTLREEALIINFRIFRNLRIFPIFPKNTLPALPDNSYFSNRYSIAQA